MTSEMPELHTSFLIKLRDTIEGDLRFHALLMGGSYIHGGFDQHSDLDFVVVVEDDHYEAVMRSRREFAAGLAPLMSAFTGEHVGEPRVLICLYGPPLLHVDMKFITADALDTRIEQPAIIFARDPIGLERKLAQADPVWPNMTPDWFEERAWVWLHYGASKLARGELYEALGMLCFFREQVLGPMLYRRAGRNQRAVRRIEAFALDNDGLLSATIAGLDAASIMAALRGAVAAYLNLRADVPPTRYVAGAPDALLEMLGDAPKGSERMVS